MYKTYKRYTVIIANQRLNTYYEIISGGNYHTMGKIIAFASQKGGTAKTTTTATFGHALIERGYKVLFIDLDGQASLTLILGGKNEPSTSTLEVLNNQATVSEAVEHHNAFDLLPANTRLSNADLKITGTDQDKYTRLKKVLEPIRHQWDYILLDCAPSLNVLPINALVCADEVIVPAYSEILSVGSLRILADMVNIIREKYNPRLRIAGILLCRHNQRTNLSKDFTEFLQDIAGKLGTKVFNTTIRESTRIREAQALKTSIYQHAPTSTVAQDYQALLDEYLQGGSTHD